MAIYHCSVKPVQRSKGRSSVAAAAYRAREKLTDERQGLTFDYSAKQDLQHTEIIGFDGSRAELWNLAELAEKRKDATTAREYEVAIPRELTTDQRIELVREYATWLHDRHGVAVDVAIHTDRADANPHAHILTTTRAPDGQGLSAVKVAREWSDAKRKKNGLKNRKADIRNDREQWATIANKHLALVQSPDRIDHRSHAERGLEVLPSIHLGHAVIAMEKKGIRTERGSRAIDVMKTNEMILQAQALTLEIQPHERRTSTLPIEHDGAVTQSAELRRDGRQDRAIRPELGATGRRHEGSIKPDNRSPQRSIGEPIGEHQQPVAKHGGRYLSTTESNQGHRATGNQEHQPSSGEDTDRINELVANLGLHGQRFGSGYGRIMALAETVQGRHSPSKLGHKNQPRMEQSNAREESHHQRDNGLEKRRRMKNDRTSQAVRQQLKAMDCKAYTIGIVSAEKDGKAWHMDNLKPDEVMAKIPNLKRLNAQGNHIFIQPAEDDHSLVLVDDVSFDDIETMAKNGHKPALTVETSPNNYQAWVKASESLTGHERAIIAKGLAKKYEADPNSAQERHYGRLAGFTNQKPEHTNSQGRQPFVLLRSSTGEPAQALPGQLRQVRQSINKQMAISDQRDYLEQVAKVKPSRKAERMAVSEYKSLQAKYGEQMDNSRADWMVAKKLLANRISKAEVMAVMVKHSPEVEERKRTVNVEAYVTRTVNKAAEAVKIENPRTRIKDSPDRGFSPDF